MPGQFDPHQVICSRLPLKQVFSKPLPFLAACPDNVGRTCASITRYAAVGGISDCVEAHLCPCRELRISSLLWWSCLG